MIPRYSRPQMANIWKADNTFRIWLEIETLACEAQAERGDISPSVAQAIRSRAAFDPSRIQEIENDVHHEFLAFLTNLAENVGPEARFIHQGMTSSDVLDTALAVQLVQAIDVLQENLEKLLAVLKAQAFRYQHCLCIGRSHGIHAEPISFGLKFAVHYAAFARHRDRLTQVRQEIATCTISGAVGTYATIDPYIETYVAEKLGLRPEMIATQIIPRDRHAVVFAVFGIIASSIEALAIEIRHLQRTEVAEVSEPFTSGQKGSSAMPHKRNPILSENLTGLARLIRAFVIPAFENIALWHERDISHSSVERVSAPDATIMLDFALARLTYLIENLVIFEQRMSDNLKRLGELIYSHRILLVLCQQGMSREKAYSLVQSHAMEVWENGGSYRDRLMADPHISALLDQEQIEQLFDPAYYLRHVETIFARVFKDE